MSAVFAQMLMLGYVEHELSRLSNGLIALRWAYRLYTLHFTLSFHLQIV